MPKPNNVNPQAYIALKAKHAAAKQARETLERQLSTAPNRPLFSVPLSDALILEHETLIAAEEGGAAYNRSASDLEGVRSFLLAELAAARAAFSLSAPLPPAPLASSTAAALAEYLDAAERYRTECEAYRAARGPAQTRLAMAYKAAREAQSLSFEQRKAANLYAPSSVVPQQADLHCTTPGNVEGIDRDVALIEAQRVDSSPNGVQSAAESRLRTLRAERAEYEDSLVVEAEAERINALPLAARRAEVERLRLGMGA
jgi:hypothetical protein